MKISALILTCDQEYNLSRAVESVLYVVDEIVILDSGPNFTASKGIAKNKRIRIYHHNWDDDFSKARNRAIELSSHNVCFFIDSDEYLHKDSRKIFTETINESLKINKKLVYAPVINNLNGKLLRNNGRIFIKRDTLKYHGMVHEYLFEPGIRIFCLEKIILIHDGYITEEVNLIKRNRNLILLETQIKNDPHNLRWYFFMLRYLDDDDREKYEILKMFSRLPLPYDYLIEIYALNAKCMFILHSINVGDYDTARIHAEEINKYYKDIVCTKLLFLSKYLSFKDDRVKSINNLSEIHNSLRNKKRDIYVLGDVCDELFNKVENEFIIDSIFSK